MLKIKVICIVFGIYTEFNYSSYGSSSSELSSSSLEAFDFLFCLSALGVFFNPPVDLVALGVFFNTFALVALGDFFNWFDDLLI